jgi:hypothetical protein
MLKTYEACTLKLNAHIGRLYNFNPLFQKIGGSNVNQEENTWMKRKNWMNNMGIMHDNKKSKGDMACTPLKWL